MDALLHHAPNGFLAQQCISKLTSVNPSTTVSALTTFSTGLSPIEHGWLGWAMYFKEIDKVVDLFSSKITGTNTFAPSGLVWKNIGYKSIAEQIRMADKTVSCYSVSPYDKPKAKTCKKLCRHIKKLCNKRGRSYIFAYHDNPDHLMHDSGCYHKSVGSAILEFDKHIEKLCGKLKDTLLIITADHGLIDIDMKSINDYPEINECLYAQISREPSNLSFHVKDEFKAVFPDIFKKYFGDSFLLFTSSEAVQKGLFGKGKPHPNAHDFLGDFVAVSIKDMALSWYPPQDNVFKAGHAGLSNKEMIVPLILVEC
jgi:hypothetical protein